MADAPRTARARARVELTAEIKRVAREQLAEVGAAALSVRAVARDLGMASSAVYRYFPGRDELLTALIVDAYGELADSAQASVASSQADQLEQRWLLLARAIRSWAVENPNEYALIYGSPVPGYAAPEDTVEPVQRLTATFLSLLADVAAADDGPRTSSSGSATSRRTDPMLDRIRSITSDDLGDDDLQAAVTAWTQLFGHLSFELFGQFHGVVDDYPSFFDAQMQRAIEPVCRLLDR